MRSCSLIDRVSFRSACFLMPARDRIDADGSAVPAGVSTTATNAECPNCMTAGRIELADVARRGQVRGSRVVRVWPVDWRVGSPRNNGLDLLETIAA